MASKRPASKSPDSGSHSVPVSISSNPPSPPEPDLANDEEPVSSVTESSKLSARGQTAKPHKAPKLAQLNASAAPKSVKPTDHTSFGHSVRTSGDLYVGNTQTSLPTGDFQAGSSASYVGSIQRASLPNVMSQQLTAPGTRLSNDSAIKASASNTAVQSRPSGSLAVPNTAPEPAHVFVATMKFTVLGQAGWQFEITVHSSAAKAHEHIMRRTNEEPFCHRTVQLVYDHPHGPLLPSDQQTIPRQLSGANEMIFARIMRRDVL